MPFFNPGQNTGYFSNVNFFRTIFHIGKCLSCILLKDGVAIR